MKTNFYKLHQLFTKTISHLNYHPDSVPSLINSHFKIVSIDYAQTIKTLVWKWATDWKINQYNLQTFSCIKELAYQELLNQCASISNIYSPQYARLIGAKSRASASAKIGLGGVR